MPARGQRGGNLLKPETDFEKPTVAQAIVGFLFHHQPKKEQMRKNRLRLRFEPDTRFEITPIPAAPFRGTQETELDVLKARLLRETLEQTTDPGLYAFLRRAANDAAAIAWTTQFPLLVFPALLEEKADAARAHYQRQQAIMARGRGLKVAA